LQHKQWNSARFKRAGLVLLATFVIGYGLSLWAQQPKDEKNAAPAEYKIPPEAAAKANPVKPTDESLARGKKMYGVDCEMCHGKRGDGKGDLGGDYKTIPDFTNGEAMKKRSDGELFYITRNGKGDMPPEDNRAKDDDVWNMVNYVKAFAKK
jgi:mono/diheme cytochrome c family protein